MDTPLEQLNILLSKLDEEDSDSRALTGRGVEMIRRIAGPQSDYSMKAHHAYHKEPSRFLPGTIWPIVRGLRDDVEAGWLSTVKETIHADVFSDYLEMAEHLLETGYKDPAAVIIGSTLENHVKQLCAKYGIPTENENGKSIKLDSLNASLAKEEIYNKLDQKNITAWSGLRNDAAHGDYNKYTIEQVTLLLGGVRNFIIRLPA